MKADSSLGWVAIMRKTRSNDVGVRAALRWLRVLGLGGVVPLGAFIMAAGVAQTVTGDRGGVGVAVGGAFVVACGAVLYREGSICATADAIRIRRLFRTYSVAVGDVADIYVEPFRLESGLRAERVIVRTKDGRRVPSGYYSIVQWRRRGPSGATRLASRLAEHLRAVASDSPRASS